MVLQNDVVSIPALRLVSLLQPLTSEDPPARAALTLLKNWNAILDADSQQAAREEVWFSRHTCFVHFSTSRPAPGLMSAQFRNTVGSTP